MHRIPVSSKQITQVGYQEHSETLEIKFEHGGVYQFFNVPADVLNLNTEACISFLMCLRMSSMD